MICCLETQPVGCDSNTCHPELSQLLTASQLPENIISSYYHFLENDGKKIGNTLHEYFENRASYRHITPLIIYNEQTQQVVTILANNKQTPPGPGEDGSILSYARMGGLDETFLCSDCYGQLSCSSCAVEVLAGDIENPTPRDEEYDMLDIDEAKPPTDKTRLSCQACIGESPLVLKIRKA